MHIWHASGQIWLQSNIFSMPFVCLLCLTNFLGYSQLSLCSLHNYLSWETAQFIYSTAHMPTFMVWQWYSFISPVLPMQDAVFHCFTAPLYFQPLGSNFSPLGQTLSGKLLLKCLRGSEDEMRDAAVGTNKGYPSPTVGTVANRGRTVTAETARAAFPGTVL